MRHDFASNIRHYDPHKWQRNVHMRQTSCAQLTLHSVLCQKKKKKKKSFR